MVIRIFWNKLRSTRLRVIRSAIGLDWVGNTCNKAQ